MTQLTKSDLHAILEDAARAALLPTAREAPTRQRRVLAPVLAAVAVAAIAIPGSLWVAKQGSPVDSGGGDTPIAGSSTEPADNQSEPTQAPTTGSRPLDRSRALELSDVTALTGSVFRASDTPDQARLSEKDALAIAGAEYGLGLKEVGLDQSDPATSSDVTTTWRLVWIVVSSEYEVTQFGGRAGNSPISGTAIVRDVTLVDAKTGEEVRAFTL